MSRTALHLGTDIKYPLKLGRLPVQTGRAPCIDNILTEYRVE